MTNGFPSGFSVGFKTSPQSATWTQLDETWAGAGDWVVVRQQDYGVASE